jgi:hypothetical protein
VEISGSSLRPSLVNACKGAVRVLIFLAVAGCSSEKAAGPEEPDAGIVDAGRDVVVDADDRSTLGGECGRDLDCAGRLVCLTWNPARVHWPAGGLCTQPCTTDADCERVAAGARCEALGNGPRFCVEGCAPGPGEVASMLGSSAKCHGRATMACNALAEGRQGCLPSCNDDAACDGAKCDPLSGHCTAKSVGGWEDIGTPEGSGACGTQLFSGTGTGVSFCTARCTVGAPSCKWDGKSARPNAACVFRANGSGYGDQGICGKLCDCDRDCAAPLHCTAMPARWAEETGRKGSCRADGAGIPCPDGG